MSLDSFRWLLSFSSSTLQHSPEGLVVLLSLFTGELELQIGPNWTFRATRDTTQPRMLNYHVEEADV